MRALGKGVAVWILGSLTFLAGLHVLEAFFALTQNAPIVLLKLYPFSPLLGQINVPAYFLVSSIATFVLWGITCMIALRNPLDMLLSRVLKDAQSENEEEVSLLSTKGNFLELMNEGLIRNTIEIGNVKDLMQNVRAEVVSLGSLQDTVRGMKSDMTSLKTSLKKLETSFSRNVLCSACGKDVQPDFRICPYCGEDLLRKKILLAEAETIKIRK